MKTKSKRTDRRVGSGRMVSQSDTPRTDVAVNLGGFQLLNVATIARELERENTKLRQLIGSAADELDNYICDCEKMECAEEMEWLRKLAKDCRAASADNNPGRTADQSIQPKT